MVYLELAAGFVLLLVGGEYLVRGAVTVARKLGVSPLLIGLTLVGFGTSTPELVASLSAVFAGSPGIAVGNVVGSNIANILLILGVAAVIAPMATTRQAFVRDGSVLVAVSVAMVAVSLAGSIGPAVGAVFILLLLAYTGYSYWSERRNHVPSAEVHLAEADSVAPIKGSLLGGLAVAVAGMAGVLLGARFLVDAAIVMAREFGISEAIIGLTVVAVGTSLPELATSVVAAFRRQADVAFGNILGSNIFNVLGIVGVTASVREITVPAEILAFDLWVMLVVALLLVGVAVTGWRVNRWEGGLFVAGYAGYIYWLFLGPAAAG